MKLGRKIFGASGLKLWIVNKPPKFTDLIPCFKLFTDGLIGFLLVIMQQPLILQRSQIAPEYLCIKEAARYTGLSRQWFEQARHKGDGPPYIKLGRAVRYKRSELDAWLLARSRRHTAERRDG